jgi:hypothetical protein
LVAVIHVGENADIQTQRQALWQEAHELKLIMTASSKNSNKHSFLIFDFLWRLAFDQLEFRQ